MTTTQPHTVWQTGPNAGRRKMKNGPRIEPGQLEITTTEKPPMRRAKQQTRYAELFAGLQYGQAIKCAPDEVNAIANALRTYLKQHKKAGEVASTRRYEKDSKGRVFLLEPVKKAARLKVA